MPATRKNAAMELAIAYETNEKETKIIKQEMELKQRNTFLGASLGIIIPPYSLALDLVPEQQGHQAKEQDHSEPSKPTPSLQE